jgi:uncharacterized phage protein (TIGR01671 family)
MTGLTVRRREVVMRDIRFRAWDVRNEVMWLRKPKQLTSEFFQLIEQDQKGGEQFVLMQFTGLSDTIDVEIYEGDIVAWSYEPVRYDSYLRNTGVIEWDPHGQWRIVQEPHIEQGIALPAYPDIKLKVIGNIYENPELLK